MSANEKLLTLQKIHTLSFVLAASSRAFFFLIAHKFRRRWNEVHYEHAMQLYFITNASLKTKTKDAFGTLAS